MRFLDDILLKSKTFRDILKEIFDLKNTISITGLADIHKIHFAHSFAKIKKQPILLLVPDEKVARKMVRDLKSMGSKASLFLLRDFNFYNIESESKEFEHLRLSTLCELLQNRTEIVVSTIEAAIQITRREASAGHNRILCSQRHT